MSRRFEDGLLSIVKSIFITDLIENRLGENEIENLINLCRSCTSAPIGFIFAAESGELRVLQFYSESTS
jgi:hypothetical protein